MCVYICRYIYIYRHIYIWTYRPLYISPARASAFVAQDSDTLISINASGSLDITTLYSPHALRQVNPMYRYTDMHKDR